MHVSCKQSVYFWRLVFSPSMMDCSMLPPDDLPFPPTHYSGARQREICSRRRRCSCRFWCFYIFHHQQRIKGYAHMESQLELFLKHSTKMIHRLSKASAEDLPVMFSQARHWSFQCGKKETPSLSAQKLKNVVLLYSKDLVCLKVQLKCDLFDKNN